LQGLGDWNHCRRDSVYGNKLKSPKSTTFWGELRDKHDDEEQWREAYNKGISDTMDCLKQLIEVALIDDTNCCSYVVAHVPNLTTMTEFDSLEAITTRNRYNAVFDKEPQ